MISGLILLQLMLYRNRRRKLSCPVKERYNLSTRACGIRTECTVVHTGGDAICKRPVNSLGIVGGAADIHEAAVASCGLTVRSPEEGHNLRARNSRIGAEGGSTGAGSDAVLDGPQDCVIVVIARVNVRERILVQHRSRASSRSPQERHNLRTGAGYIRAEGITAGAAGDTLVDSPLPGTAAGGVFWRKLCGKKLNRSNEKIQNSSQKTIGNRRESLDENEAILKSCGNFTKTGRIDET